MSSRSKLIGAWELVSYTITNVDDPEDVMHPMTKACKGIIMYTPDGFMSANMTNPETSSPYKKGPFSGTTEELTSVASNTIAYAGPYYLEEGENEDGTLRLSHEMTVSIPPNWTGSVQERPAKIVEENGHSMLHLTGKPATSNGVTKYPTISWRKLEDNSQGKPPSKM